MAASEVTSPTTPSTILDVEQLCVADRRGTTLVDDVSFGLVPGRTLGLVGASGSGKSMTARAIMGLLPPGVHVAGGDVRLAGQSLRTLPARRLRAYRGRQIAMVFQDPTRALNPLRRVGDQVAEAIRNHQHLSRRECHRRVVDLLDAVRIPAAEQRVRSFPHELSGGMRQRVVLAAALAADPQVLIADEPTTALDVTVQAQILELLAELRAERRLAVLLITHDLGLAAWHTDEIAVMERGAVVESAATDALFSRPRHLYTRALIAAAPRFAAAATHTEPARPDGGGGDGR